MAKSDRHEGAVNVTRRGFLQVAGSVAAAAVLAGCAASEQPAAGSTPAIGSGSAIVPVDAGSSETTAAPSPITSSDASGDIEPGDLEGTYEDPNAEVITAVAPNDPYGSGKHHATIEIADHGTMSVTLDADAAPITVSNFCRLANEGFYDGLRFFRIMAGFMMQGGDPYNNGTGDSGRFIKGEFRANGVNNKLLHTRGTISMARADDYNSASSQFFIMHAANHESLDGNYAAFGHLTSGIEIVDEICANVVNTDDNGGVAESNQPVITKITILD